MWKDVIKKFKPYVIGILIALGVGGLSALFTKDNMNIFDSMNKPALTPPMWLFPVVWGILFTLMGISSVLVWKNGKDNLLERDASLRTYGAQLAVNFFWSIIFFNMQEFLFAFIWLILLWLLITRMILQFYKIDNRAAYLQIPYLLWVTFAGYLTLMIYLLNR